MKKSILLLCLFALQAMNANAQSCSLERTRHTCAVETSDNEPREFIASACKQEASLCSMSEVPKCEPAHCDMPTGFTDNYCGCERQD